MCENTLKFAKKTLMAIKINKSEGLSSCHGCYFWKASTCPTNPMCVKEYRNDGNDIIWKDVSNEQLK